MMKSVWQPASAVFHDGVLTLFCRFIAGGASSSVPAPAGEWLRFTTPSRETRTPCGRGRLACGGAEALDKFDTSRGFDTAISLSTRVTFIVTVSVARSFRLLLLFALNEAFPLAGPGGEPGGSPSTPIS